MSSCPTVSAFHLSHHTPDGGRMGINTNIPCNILLGKKIGLANLTVLLLSHEPDHFRIHLHFRVGVTGQEQPEFTYRDSYEKLSERLEEWLATKHGTLTSGGIPRPVDEYFDARIPRLVTLCGVDEFSDTASDLLRAFGVVDKRFWESQKFTTEPCRS